MDKPSFKSNCQATSRKQGNSDAASGMLRISGLVVSSPCVSSYARNYSNTSDNDSNVSGVDEHAFGSESDNSGSFGNDNAVDNVGSDREEMDCQEVSDNDSNRSEDSDVISEEEIN
ncbi:ATP synthase subunit delta [Frankliniella fusca]|uniref:ATP synthase subunit delta n=1 Tax=Frankliniella fusca TaxID=407009 RepID=A0AAE1I437_9NEOP|nr:ATP synthase subunit delta [Frankliniella fusca]